MNIIWKKYFKIKTIAIRFLIISIRFIVNTRDERKVGDSPTAFLAVACTSEELNKFRIEYEKCHQKAVSMIEEQRPFDENMSASR